MMNCSIVKKNVGHLVLNFGLLNIISEFCELFTRLLTEGLTATEGVRSKKIKSPHLILHNFGHNLQHLAAKLNLLHINFGQN